MPILPSLGLSTRNVAFLAIFIALSVMVIRFVPGIPIVGVPGSEIKFDAAIAPIYGMIIGPYLGFLAALIGGLLTSGSPFTFLTSFAPAISAMVAGFLTHQKITDEIEIPGWIAASTILGMLIVGWYLTWVGRQAPFYPILHLAGFFAILITRKWIVKSFEQIGLKKEIWQFRSEYILVGIIIIAFAYLFSKPYVSEFLWNSLPYFSLPLYIIAAILILYGIFGRGKYSFVSSTFLASYCGIISDHMLGNIIFIQVIDIFIPFKDIQDSLDLLGLPDVPSLFMYMIPASAAERIIMTVIATLFAVGLLMALFRAGYLSKQGE